MTDREIQRFFPSSQILTLPGVPPTPPVIHEDEDDEDYGVGSVSISGRPLSYAWLYEHGLADPPEPHDPLMERAIAALELYWPIISRD